MAAGVVDDAALGDGDAAVELVGLHQRAARRVHFDFERDAELVAVAEHGAMCGGQARGAGVEVMVFLPCAGLARAVDEVHLRAVADAPVAAAGAMARFKNGAGPAGLAQLVGRDKAGNASAENHDARAFAVDEAEGLAAAASGAGNRPRDCMRTKAVPYPPAWPTRVRN